MLGQMSVVILVFLFLQYSAGTPEFEGAEIDARNINYRVSVYSSGSRYCGGALITPDTVLTMKYSTFFSTFSTAPTTYSVGIGGESYGETAKQTIQIESYLIHPNRDIETIDSHLCLLKLMENVTLSSKLGLTRIAENYNYVTGSFGTFSGFNLYYRTSKTGIEMIYPNQRYVPISISIGADCNSTFHPVNISNGIICVEDFANKYSYWLNCGSPLFQNGKLIGLLNYGIGSTTYGTSNNLGMCTNIAKYVDWIVENSNYEKSGTGLSAPGTVIMIVAILFYVAGL